MKPEVSVILTVYRRLEFLRQALESAIAQTFTSREIIVADDSGIAAAEKICEPLVCAGTIRYRANSQTLGIAANLRSAIAAAEGEFISILNDDDMWEPNFLSELVPPLRRDPRRVLTFSDHWIMGEDGKINEAETDLNTRRYGRAALPSGDIENPEEFVVVKNGVPLAMASVFRKHALDLALLADEVSGAYDFWISCMLAASGGKFYYNPQRLTFYRAHSRSETARRSPDRCANHVYIYSQLIQRNWFPGLRHFLQRALTGTIFILGRDKLYFDQVKQARRCFLMSLRTHPNLKAIVGLLLSYLPRSFRVRLGLTTERLQPLVIRSE